MNKRLNIGWLLKLTSFRFSKDYRHGTTLYHRMVYSVIDTVGSNITAGLGVKK